MTDSNSNDVIDGELEKQVFEISQSSINYSRLYQGMLLERCSRKSRNKGLLKIDYLQSFNDDGVSNGVVDIQTIITIINFSSICLVCLKH